MRQLLASGRVAYGYVGVTTEDLTPSVARHFGYERRGGRIVAEVPDDSPGDRAGLRGGDGDETVQRRAVISTGGDVIVAIDGQKCAAPTTSSARSPTAFPGSACA